jgi:hypothetical protein
MSSNKTKRCSGGGAKPCCGWHVDKWRAHSAHNIAEFIKDRLAILHANGIGMGRRAALAHPVIERAPSCIESNAAGESAARPLFAIHGRYLAASFHDIGRRGGKVKLIRSCVRGSGNFVIPELFGVRVAIGLARCNREKIVGGCHHANYRHPGIVHFSARIFGRNGTGTLVYGRAEHRRADQIAVENRFAIRLNIQRVNGVSISDQKAADPRKAPGIKMLQGTWSIRGNAI